MTRFLRPPELKRAREQEQFNPIREGDRYGLSRELSLAIWERVCADATNSAGRRDEEQARQRFHELAACIASRGGRLRPDPGRVTRVDVELNGESLGTWAADELRPRVPGRQTLVAIDARRWAKRDIPTARNASTSIAGEASGLVSKEVDDGIARCKLPGASEVALAMAALQAPPQPDQSTSPPPALINPAPPRSDWLTDHPLLLGNATNPPVSSRWETWAALGGRAGAQLDDEARDTSWMASTATAKPSITIAAIPPATRMPPGEQVFRRARDGDVPGHVARATLMTKLAGSHGTPLPTDLRMSLAQQLGNLDDVHVHTDELADRAARALSADAFAVGKDIYFAAGMYEPSSASGQRLIAHEVMHTAQAAGANGGLHLHVSSPGDAHEQQADAFADAFVAAPQNEGTSAKLRHAQETPREAEIVSPQHRDAPRLVTPVAFAGISRHPSRSPSSMSSRTALHVPDVDLFGATSKEKNFTHVDSVVPLARGVILLGEIPATYNADASLKVSSMLRGVFGPGKLSGLQVELSDTEMMGHDLMDDDPIVGIPLVPIRSRWTPRIGIGPSPQDLYDKVILREPHTAEGWASAKAHASAEAFASATVSGGVAALDVFGGGVTGGVHARAQATADANASIYASVSYAGGVVTITSLKLGSDLEFAWDLSLGASAGVYVELKMPNIPVISELSHALQSVPVVNWFVPDLTKLTWRKDFTRSWNLPVSRGVKSWKKDWELAVSGSSPSAAHSLSMSEEGFDLGQLVKDQLAARNPDKGIPGKDEGPDKELKDGASAGAVANTRQAAKAQAKSARDDIKREQAWNKKELTRTVAAIKKAAAHVKAATIGGPAAIAIGEGGGTPEEQHKAALEARDQKLADIEQGVQNVDKKIDEVRDAAENEPDGPSRNYARKGYEALGKTADSIGQDVAGYGAHADKYKRPVAPNSPQNANTAEAEKARLEARRTLDENSEKVDTELIRVDRLWQDSNGVPEIATYTVQIDAYRADIRIQCERPLKRANKDWENVPSMFSEPHEQTRNYREIIIPEAMAVGVKLEAEKAKLPKAPWDEKWVILENRKLMLIPSHRGSREIRNTMYRDYKKSSLSWLDRRLEKRPSVKFPGKTEWKYGEASPVSESTGEPHWWLLDGPDKERPTIAHDHPSVGHHWNSDGRFTTQDARAIFINGLDKGGPALSDDAKRDKNLGIEPKTVNSAKANKHGVKLNPEVGVTFKGPK